MPFKKWTLPLSLILVANQFHTVCAIDKLTLEQVQQEFILENEIQNCRLALQGFSSSNPQVLKMFEETVGQWHFYTLHEDRDFDLKELLKAITFAAIKHEGQVRKDEAATPYIIHPIGVARTLWEEGKIRDLNVLTAALLHDTLEDTDTTKEEIEMEFGASVSFTVEELTNDPNLSGEENKLRQVDHAPHLSKNAKLVKLADRLYNVRDLKTLPPSWGQDKVKGYLVWGQKLLHALEGTNGYLEGALQHEIDQQNSFSKSGS